MKFLGYYVDGKNYGCTKTAKEKAEKDAVKKGLEVYRAIYKI